MRIATGRANMHSIGVLLVGLLAQKIFSYEFTPTGQTVELDGIPYYLPPNPVATLHAESVLRSKASASGGWTPLTVIVTNDTKYSSQDLQATITSYTASDDVFSPGFLAAIYVQHTASVPRGYRWSSPTLTNTTNSTSSCISSTSVSNQSLVLPAGPYFFSSTGAIYEAWRLYSDLAGAFLESLTTTTGGETYSVLPAGVAGQAIAIAVPSRLYFTKTSAKPLAGVRLGIKDIFDIAGVRTSNGNRAWYTLYPPATEHATPVQRLIEAGAVIVGMQSLSLKSTFSRHLLTSRRQDENKPVCQWRNSYC